MDRVVVGELGEGKPCRPIIMLGADVGSKDLLDGAVGDLRLAIGLRVMGG